MQGLIVIAKFFLKFTVSVFSLTIAFRVFTEPALILRDRSCGMGLGRSIPIHKFFD